MTKTKTKSKVSGKPAVTPEEREQQMVSLAMDLAEKQLREGTASPSVISHFLKLGSMREQLEESYLSKKTEHIGAQIDAIHSSAHAEELYQNALDAMRKYSGHEPEEEL